MSPPATGGARGGANGSSNGGAGGGGDGLVALGGHPGATTGGRSSNAGSSGALSLGGTTGGAAQATGGVAALMGGATHATGGATRTAGGATHAIGGATHATGGVAHLAGGVAALMGGAAQATGGATQTAGGATQTMGGTGGVAACNGSYVACGCGCCEGPSVQAATACYYPETGPSYAAIVDADQARKHSPDCASQGCSRAQKYACCVAAAPEVGGDSRYTATLRVGALDRIVVTKASGDDCASFTLASPVTDGFYSNLALPSGWALQTGSHQACSSSASASLPIGALGTIALVKSGDTCQLNAHLTLFLAGTTTDVDRVRIDIDRLEIQGASGWYCTP